MKYNYIRKEMLAVIPVCAFIMSTPAMAEKAPKTNVLLLTADDMGWDSLGCTGNPLPDLSPNLDKLASEGILIENCHIATPICGPSRNALLTGQFPQTNGYMGHGIQPPSWWEKSKKETQTEAISAKFTQNGYETGCIGKHGSKWGKFTVKPEGRYEITGMGRDPSKYYAYVRDFFAKAKKNNKPFFLMANTHDPHRYFARHPDENAAWIKSKMHGKKWTPYPNGKPYPDPKMDYKPEDCPMPAAYPNDPELKKMIRYYYGSVNRMDEVVGEVLRALDESGMADNTIVIFLSDHGMAWDLAKWSLYPLGTKTPLIIRWPGKIKPGSRNKDSILSAVDIAPTILDLCGIEKFKNPDGMSFRCLLFGDKVDWKRKEAFSCFNYMNNLKKYDDTVKEYSSDLYKKVEQYRPSRALSSNHFTYVWNGWSNGENKLPREMLGEAMQLIKKAAKNPQDKTYPDYKKRVEFIQFRAPEELYDTVKDPGCLNNLADNPEYQTVIENFHKKMIEILKKTKDHEEGNYDKFLSQK